MPPHTDLRDQLHAAVRRVDALRERAAHAPAPLLDEALEELLTALEELRVTEEELSRQTDVVAAQQARVEEEHHRYLALFHFAPDPYLVTDLDGVVREANRAAGELLGVAESRLAGKPLAVFVAPPQSRAFRTALSRLPAQGRVDGWDLRLHPRGQQAVEVSCTVAVERDRRGCPRGLRWLLRDVTERRAAEETRRRLEAEQAARAEAEAAREQLAELAAENERLYLESRQATRAREEVLAVVSHDLRNPLNAVLLAATILDEYTESERWTERERKQLRTIRNSAQQMSALIGDLVEAVALESGQRALHPEALDPARLLADAVELHRGLAQQKGIALEAEAAPGLPTVEADRARLLQVLANLLGNAIKFTPGGGTVTLGAAPREGGLGFFVSDTGPGIPPEQLPHVFERYWRAEGGDRQGLGLGLAIARGIVEAHGGRIWVQSAPGQGTTFFFTLPLRPT